eukprot:TRINITY_DN2498_c0_g1_i2.p1 TRINITY_DN2498_c0_g1~~TRINITY_DN2498_c0_g1_i2.p1  ORF type:complete len:498 (+),score=112.98 TRINITY_DN2498_c0_g1_i2:52-1545(+)
MSDLMSFDEATPIPSAFHIPCVLEESSSDESRFCLYYVRSKQLFPASNAGASSGAKHGGASSFTPPEDAADRLLSHSPNSYSPTRDSVKLSPHFFGEEQAIHPVCYNTSAAEEVRLRSLIASKLYSHEVYTTGNIYLMQDRSPSFSSSGSSSFGQSDFSAITVCYYSAISVSEEGLDALDNSILSNSSKQSQFTDTAAFLLKKSLRPGRDILEENAGDFYIVCFMKDFDNEDGFESFRPELDEYCSVTLRKLLTDYKIEDGQVSLTIRECLRKWYSANVSYINHSVDVCAPVLDYVIHAIMTFLPVKVLGSEEASSGMRKFISNVQSPFLAFRGDEGRMDGSPEETIEESLIDLSPQTGMNAPHLGKVVTIDLSDEDYPKVTPQVSNEFCSQWASELQTYRGDPLRIRKIIQLYQMKVTQEMNKLNRSLKKAETDNYELYKCYLQIKDNPNQDILSHLLLSAPSQDDDLREEVISVLREYLKGKTDSEQSAGVSDLF